MGRESMASGPVKAELCNARVLEHANCNHWRENWNVTNKGHGASTQLIYKTWFHALIFSGPAGLVIRPTYLSSFTPPLLRLYDFLNLFNLTDEKYFNLIKN